jgi:hypothetical protein
MTHTNTVVKVAELAVGPTRGTIHVRRVRVELITAETDLNIKLDTFSQIIEVLVEQDSPPHRPSL